MTFVIAICFGRATDSKAFFSFGRVGFRTANCGRGADRRERRLDIAILRARSDWVDAQREKNFWSVKDQLLTAARPRGSSRKACGGSRYSTPCKQRGLEWTKMFSRRTFAMFDYVFTGSQTWINNRRKRMRLWIPSEVGTIGNEQESMRTMVDWTNLAVRGMQVGVARHVRAGGVVAEGGGSKGGPASGIAVLLFANLPGTVSRIHPFRD